MEAGTANKQRDGHRIMELLNETRETSLALRQRIENVNAHFFGVVPTPDCNKAPRETPNGWTATALDSLSETRNNLQAIGKELARIEGEFGVLESCEPGMTVTLLDGQSLSIGTIASTSPPYR